MSLQEQYVFEPGADLAASLGGYASLVTQAIRQAYPNSYRGMTISSSVQPSVFGQPNGFPLGWNEWHRRCLWIDPVTGVTSSYKEGTGWINVASLIPAGTITSAMIQDQAVTLGKISRSGAPGSAVLQLNSNGTVLSWVLPSTIHAPGSLGISVLANGSVAAKEVLKAGPTGPVWGALTTGDLPLGFNRAFLRTQNGAVVWGSFNASIDMGVGSLPIDRLIAEQEGSLLIAKRTPSTATQASEFLFEEVLPASLEKVLPVKSLIAGPTGTRLTSDGGEVKWTAEPEGLEAMVVLNGTVDTTQLSVSTVSTSDNEITFSVNHGLSHGDVIWSNTDSSTDVHTSTNGIVANIPYFAEVVSATKIKLHASKLGALEQNVDTVVSITGTASMTFRVWNNDPILASRGIDGVIRVIRGGSGGPGYYGVGLSKVYGQDDYAVIVTPSKSPTLSLTVNSIAQNRKWQLSANVTETAARWFDIETFAIAPGTYSEYNSSHQVNAEKLYIAVYA
jgi:hypothetical protein